MEEAAALAADLEGIRRALRDSITAQARGFDVPLTPPQLLALELLVAEDRESGAGLSLSELSARMGLSHSTASGIVTRLERRGLLQRRPRADDRRFTQIELTEPVRRWLETRLPASRMQPLADALARAGTAERAQVLTGVRTLARLLTDPAERS
jgi:DNA-binding MarR family transcriptional regulator